MIERLYVPEVPKANAAIPGPKSPKEIKTLTLKTAGGKNEYVAQLGNSVTDRVGRKTGFKATDTSPNFQTEAERNKWVKQNIESQDIGAKPSLTCHKPISNKPLTPRMRIWCRCQKTG